MEPQNPSLFTKQPILFGVPILIIGIIIGAFAGPYFPFSSSSSSSYQAGFNAAKDLVEQSSLGSMLRGSDDVRTLSGTVTAVNGTSIMLHTVSKDPFADPSLGDRTILVNTSTKIFEFTQKDPKVLQSEMAAFTKAAQSGSSVPFKEGTQPAVPPAPFVQTATDVTSITVGSVLTVTALENIKSMKEFTASEIQIQSQVAPPATPL
jgi:hypothetical protein